MRFNPTIKLADRNGKGASQVYPAPPRLPTLKDPDRPRIDVRVADHLEMPAPSTVADQALYTFVVTESFKAARESRSRWEPTWKLSLEFHAGNQWWGWDAKNSKYINYMQSDPNPLRFSTTNLIRPRIETVGSMVTQSRPESQVAPLTSRPMDKEAAQEARSVVAHYNRLYDNANQVRRMVDWAMTHTSCFLKTTFEPSAMADKPIFGDTTKEDVAEERGVVTAGDIPPEAAMPSMPPVPPMPPEIQGAVPPASSPSMGQGMPPQPPLPPAGQPEEPQEPEQEITGIEHAQIGDIVERIVPGTNIFIDPACSRFDDARWLIHAEVYPLSWYWERFENGDEVKADAGTGSGGRFSHSDTVGLGTSFGIGDGDPVTGASGAKPNRDVATCYEMWILPNKVPLFPQGALITCAGGVVLRPRNSTDGSPTTSEAAWAKALGAKLTDEESVNKAKKKIPGHYLPWPYACQTEFPFVDLGFDDNPDSPYCRSLVQDMVEPQQDYNRTRTRIRELLEKSKPLWMIPKLGITGAERWEDYGTYTKVFFDSTVPNGAGQIITPPPIPAEQFRILETIERTLDDTAGIHDPNFRGTAPAGVTSGVAIDALKQGDSSRLSRFAARIERMVMKRDTWRIRHAGQFFDEPRLMGMDDSGNPATAVSVAQAFKALSGGGQVRVLVAPGSSLSDTPAGRNQKLVSWYQMGIYGPPGTPGAAKILAELMEGNDGDVLLQRLGELEEKIGADGKQGGQEPVPPTPEQQMQMQIEQMKLQSQMETEKEIALIQAQSQARLAERENEYLLQRKYGPLIGSPSAKLTPGAEVLVEESIFGESDLHEAQGHVISAALSDETAGQAYGITPPKPPPMPAQGKPGAKNSTSSTNSTSSPASKGIPS